MNFGRLFLAGLATAVAAIIGNFLVAAIIGALADIPAEFEPFMAPRYILFTVLGVIGATIVYWLLARSGPAGVSRFTKVAIVVLIISLIPDLGLLVSNALPGTTTAGIIGLMLMHVVTAVACILLLPRIAPPE
jgi:hypothetical protein